MQEYKNSFKRRNEKETETRTPGTHLPVGNERHVPAGPRQHPPDATKKRVPEEIRARRVHELAEVFLARDHVVVDQPHEIRRKMPWTWKSQEERENSCCRVTS